MKKILALATFAALCAAQPALAEKTGFYVGADVGQSSMDINKGDLDTALLTALEFYYGDGIVDGTSDLDDSDTTFALTVGYRFMPYLAVEGQYLDLGEAKYTAGGDVYDAFGKFLGVGAAEAKVNSSGFGLSVLGILPIQETWEVFARLGVYFGDTEASSSVSLDGFVEPDLTGSDSKNENEFFYGIGGGYTFNETWNVRAEYTVFQDIGDEDLTGEADVDRFVLGVNYRF